MICCHSFLGSDVARVPPGMHLAIAARILLLYSFEVSPGWTGWVPFEVGGATGSLPASWSLSLPVLDTVMSSLTFRVLGEGFSSRAKILEFGGVGG